MKKMTGRQIMEIGIQLQCLFFLTSPWLRHGMITTDIWSYPLFTDPPPYGILLILSLIVGFTGSILAFSGYARHTIEKRVILKGIKKSNIFSSPIYIKFTSILDFFSLIPFLLLVGFFFASAVSSPDDKYYYIFLYILTFLAAFSQIIRLVFIIKFWDKLKAQRDFFEDKDIQILE